MGLVSVELDESVKDLAIYEALFLQGLESLPKVQDDTTISIRAASSAQAAAEEIVSQEE